MEQFSKPAKIFLAIMAITGWFSLISQFYLIILNRTASITETIIRYFSFFTLLTNLLVACCCFALLIKSRSSARSFFARQNTLTAITVYIVIVGIIYNLILRYIWKPYGLQKIADELLHSVIPVLFLLFWLIFVKKDRLKWNVSAWLIYPFVYAVFILFRGAISSFYPYPFINVDKLGLHKTFVNVVGLTLVFLIASLLFVAIGKLMSRKGSQ